MASDAVAGGGVRGHQAEAGQADREQEQVEHGCASAWHHRASARQRAIRIACRARKGGVKARRCQSRASPVRSAGVKGRAASGGGATRKMFSVSETRQ